MTIANSLLVSELGRADRSEHRLPVQVRAAAQSSRRDVLRVGVVVLRLADAADRPAVRDDHPIETKLPPQHLVVERSVGAGGRADAVVQALRADGIVPAPSKKSVNRKGDRIKRNI